MGREGSEPLQRRTKKHKMLRKQWRKHKKTIFGIIQALIMILLLDNLGWLYGTIGIAGWFLGFALYKLYKNREQFINSLRIIEMKIFKKPLDREYWEVGELKKLKFKIVWPWTKWKWRKTNVQEKKDNRNN